MQSLLPRAQPALASNRDAFKDSCWEFQQCCTPPGAQHTNRSITHTFPLFMPSLVFQCWSCAWAPKLLFLPYSMGAASTGVTHPRTITSHPPSPSLSRLKPSYFLPELLFISHQAAVITPDKRQTFINKQRPTFICRTSSDPAEVLLLSHC